MIEAGRGILEDSTAPEPWQECISISRADRFEVADNKVHHGHMEGIDAKADSRNGTIHHNIVHDLDRLGIYIDAWDGENRDIDVFENVVYACPEGIRVNAENGGTAERIRVYGNIVSGCTGNGFWVGVGGVLGESFTIRDIELFGNVSRGNERGFTISVRENSVTERIGVYNNLVYGNGYNGIAVDDYSNKSDVRYITGVLSDIKIVNNTVWGNGFELDPPEPVDWAHGGIFVTASNAEKVLIRNNIVGENRNFAIALHYGVPESEVTIDHNLIRTAAAHPREVLGTEYIEEDPAFVNEKAAISASRQTLPRSMREPPTKRRTSISPAPRDRTATVSISAHSSTFRRTRKGIFRAAADELRSFGRGTVEVSLRNNWTEYKFSVYNLRYA